MALHSALRLGLHRLLRGRPADLSITPTSYALHHVVLDRLGEQGRVDWKRASVDTMSGQLGGGLVVQAQIDREAGQLAVQAAQVVDGDPGTVH